MTDVVNTSGEAAVTLVSTFHVSLSKPVIFPTNKSTVVPVCVKPDIPFHCCLKGMGATCKELV